MVKVHALLAALFAFCLQDAFAFEIPLPKIPPDFFEPVKHQGKCMDKYGPPCKANFKYRTYDGSCNNLLFPSLGRAHTTYKRMFPDSYKNDKSSIVTQSPNNVPLPNARTITQTIFTTSERTTTCKPDPFWPVLMISFCQFVTHDMASTVLAIDSYGETLDCPCDSKNPNCMSMRINSPRFPSRCMKMPRAASANELFGCYFKRRQSVNSHTAYLDLSQVYGVSVAENRMLRSYVGGKLLTSPGVVKDCPYLPTTRHSGSIKFVAGDERTNENLGLVAVHTLFLREHNRLAEDLADIHPDWNDEMLFQEARRINIAVYQHAIYNELLPILFGSDYMSQLSINTLTSGYANTYNNQVNSSISVEFAAAAFRFGHAINAQLYCFTDSLTRSSCSRNLTFPEIVENSRFAYDVSEAHGIEAIMNGLLTPAMAKFGSCFSDGLVNCLFNNDAQPCIDLPATNIMRGRELGLPFYKTVRDILNVYTTPARDIGDIMNSTMLPNLLKLYGRDASGIDFFVGGLLELIRQAPRPVLTSTSFGIVIGKQFQDLKFGDRFFYDYPPTVNPGAFTLDQLQLIRGQSLSKLICLNFPKITRVLRFALVLGNIAGEVNCDLNAMKLDLSSF